MTVTLHAPITIRDALTTGRALTAITRHSVCILGHVTDATTPPAPGTPLHTATETLYPGRSVYDVPLTDEHLAVLIDGHPLNVIVRDTRENWRTAGVVTVTPTNRITLSTGYGDFTFTPVLADDLRPGDVFTHSTAPRLDGTVRVNAADADFNRADGTILCTMLRTDTKPGRQRHLRLRDRIVYRVIAADLDRAHAATGLPTPEHTNA